MSVKKVLVISVKILAVSFAFGLCTVVGGALSGLNKIGQSESSSLKNVQQAPPTLTPVSSFTQTAPETQSTQTPENPALSFLVFCLCAGIVVSYVILRSSWYGWPLVAVVFVGIFGIATVESQIESVFFLSDKLPHGLIRALFLQGAIATALFTPVAVLLLGKWRGSSHISESLALRTSTASAIGRLAVIVVAFVFLYLFFGYYIAWQNPALRAYYGGTAYPDFFASLKANWTERPSIYALQVFRALLYVVCLYPIVRMLRTARWEAALAIGLFLAAWTTVLLLPNPLMPASVAHSHFAETLSFSIVFGALAGWLLWGGSPLATVK